MPPAKRILVVYTAQQTLHWLTLGLLIPVATLLKLDKGLGLFQVGLVGALYSGTVVLLELPTGGLADALGRKRVYLLSVLFMGAGMLVVALGRGFAPVASGFVLYGISRALSSGSIEAWFIDEYQRLDPGGDLQKACAVVNVFVLAGLGAGSLLGGLLPMMSGGFFVSRGLSAYTANLAAVVVLLAAQSVLTSLAVEEPGAIRVAAGVLAGFRRTPAVLRSALAYGLRNRLVLLLIGTSLAWGFTFAGLEEFWQPRVRWILGPRAGQTWIFGLLSAGYFLASSLGNLVITPVCRLFRNNYGAILAALRVLTGSLLAVLALQNGLGGFSIFYLALYLTNGLSASPHTALFNREVPAAQRATLLSLDSFCLQAGGCAGALLTGYLAGRASIAAGWLIGAAILAASGVLYSLAAREAKAWTTSP